MMREELTNAETHSKPLRQKDAIVFCGERYHLHTDAVYDAPDEDENLGVAFIMKLSSHCR